MVFKTAKATIIKTNTTSNTTIKPAETTPAVTPTVDTSPSVVTDNQNSIIQITDDAKDVSVNDEVNYLVSFKNTATENFENAKITVQLPTQVDFEASNFGQNGDNNTVTFDVGTLIPAQVGSMTIKGKINSKAVAQDILITTAVMSYNTTSSDVEQDQIAYVTNNVLAGSASGLAANSLFGANFLPVSLMGWLILILIIVALAFISRIIYMKYTLRKARRNVNADHINNLPM